MNNDFIIQEIGIEHKSLVGSFISEKWGSPMSVSKGRMFDTTQLPGFICVEDSIIAGLVTYNIDTEGCEIVTLNSEQGNQGLGTRLIEKVIEKAKENDCQRVWLITTNDNSNAIRYYQKRGFEWVGFYKNAMEGARKLKPEIHKVGDHGIPVKHEIEFELRLE